MLACARIGAIHSVVFGGFSAGGAARPHQRRAGEGASSPPTAATAAARSCRSRRTPTRRVAECPSIENVVVVHAPRRAEEATTRRRCRTGRDHWYHDLMRDAPTRVRARADGLRAHALHRSTPRARPASRRASCTRPAAISPASTRRRKWVFDLKEDDVYWCTADIGWVTGHSYVVYGPLANGATVLMYEGAPDWPKQDRFWEIIERHKVTIFYTAPTAIRAFMKWGEQLPASARPVVAAPARHPSASRSIPKHGCGTTRTSAASAARSSTPGGRPRPARS